MVASIEKNVLKLLNFTIEIFTNVEIKLDIFNFSCGT